MEIFNMNWKQFKAWLEENVIENEGFEIKIKSEKQSEYGNISTIVLTNFYDSLGATLDKNDSYHLFPEFSDSKNFTELFEYQNCDFGKKTNQDNQEKVNEVDYKLLEKLFNGWKNKQRGDKATIVDNNDNAKENVIENDPVSDVRNILLIGRTGSGKSTLANVLMDENKFRESSKSISITKNIEEGAFEVELDEEGKEKIKYRVIDTIGIGDTKMKPQGVLMRLAEMADRVKQEGLNQILFVTRGRFNKEEIEAYDLLSSIIFDKEVINYTTLVRTGFEEFEDREACDDDRGSLRTENAALAHILGAVDIVYLNNPSIPVIKENDSERIKGKKKKQIEDNQEIREESRKRILTHLGGCRKTYRPENIDSLDERIQDYKTHEEKLKEKMKELEKSRKEQEAEFRKKLTELKEDQVKELRENRKKFEEDLNKVKTEGEESLRKTVNEMEDKQKKRVEEMEKDARKREKEREERHAEERKREKEERERQEKIFQEETQRRREEEKELRNKLVEANNSTMEFMKQQRADDKAREERQERERRELEERRLKAEEKRQQEEKQHREKMEKIEKMNAAWASWEKRNRQYLQEQRSKMFWNRHSNWESGLTKPSENPDDYK